MNLIASSSSDLVAAFFGSMITIAALMTWNKVSSDNKRSEQNRIVFEADKIKEEFLWTRHPLHLNLAGHKGHEVAVGGSVGVPEVDDAG